MKIKNSHISGILSPSAGNPRNSEGSFIRLKDGRIAFAYSRFVGNSWGDDADSDIAAVYSDDDGTTFDTEHPETIVRASEYGNHNVMSVSLTYMNNGDIGLFYGQKFDGLMRDRFYLRRYKDDFTRPESEVCCLPQNVPGYYVVNNDRIVSLSDGSWLIPAAHHPSSMIKEEGKGEFLDLRGTAVFFVSDDDGRTWRQTHGRLNLPYDDSWTGLQEPGVIELSEGILYGYFRTDKGYQFESVSIDRGESWFMPRPSKFTSPESPLLIKKNPYSGIYFAVWNPVPNGVWRKVSPYSWGRTPLVMAQSDDGIHFGDYEVIEDDPDRGFCYPAMYFTDDRSVLLAYCSGSKEDGCCLSRTTIRKITLE